MPTRSGLVAAFLVSLLSAGCVTDHDALAARDRGDRGDSGRNAPPQPPDGSGAPSADDASVEGGRVAEDTGTAGPVEPAGPRTLTLVHGIVDERARIAFCFASIREGEIAAAAGRPVPPGGLAYGESLTLDAIEGMDLARDGLRPYVLAGDLSLIEGLDCQQAIDRAREIGSLESDAGAGLPPAADAGNFDADVTPPEPEAGASIEGGADAAPDARNDASVVVGGDAAVDSGDGDALEGSAPAPPPPPLRAAGLATIPEGTFEAERGFLLVAAGCMGGPAFTDPAERSACGDFYRPDQPTLTPLVVATSRKTEPDVVGLQFVNASVALSRADLHTSPTESSNLDGFAIARDVVTGEIAPRTSQLRRSAASLGAMFTSARLLVRRSGNSDALYQQSWPEALTAGKIETLRDGASYTVILLGPFPSFGARAWYNGPLLTVVSNGAPGP